MNILLIGGSGRLGREFLSYNKCHNIDAPRSIELNITNKNSCENFFKNKKYDLVILAAAITNSINCEINYIDCIKTNIVGVFNILEECKKLNTKLVYISTDYVFDGKKGNYTENDAINPITNYAKSKAAGELIARMYEKSLIIRTSFFDKEYPYSTACIDQWSSKNYIDLLIKDIYEACLSEDYGIKHIGSKRRKIYDIALERKKDVLKCSRLDFNIYIPFDTSFKIGEKE